jgi:uncharacterized membrane protein
MNKFLKVFLVLLLSIFGIILITALFVRKDYKVERSISINRPKQVVYDYVKYLKNQNEYSVWAKIDPEMKKDFRGIDATAGFISAWDSQVKEAGKGEQEIVKIIEGERIDYVIRFFKPMKSTNNAFMSFKSENDSTTNVTWAFYGKMKYPTNLSLLFLDMDAMLGKDLSGGLSNLKVLLEK